MESGTAMRGGASGMERRLSGSLARRGAEVPPQPRGRRRKRCRWHLSALDAELADDATAKEARHRAHARLGDLRRMLDEITRAPGAVGGRERDRGAEAAGHERANDIEGEAVHSRHAALCEI